MIDSSGRRFIQLLEPQRGALYGAALAAMGLPAAAETCIQRAVRGAFREFVQGPPPREFGPWVQRHLETQIAQQAAASENTGKKATPVTDAAAVAMPAAIWARLAAAIQIESVKIHGPTGDDEEALLAYDPLLVPKKPAPADDLSDGLNLSPWSRFVLAATIVLIIGVVATVVLTTRHAPPEAQTPTTHPAATQPLP